MKIGAINFKPSVTNDGLIYQYKKQLTYFSLDDGSIIWQSKEKKDADYVITGKKDKIFIIEAKNVSAQNIHNEVEKARVAAMPKASAVAWRRLGRKAGNERRTRVGPDIVAMPVFEFVLLLKAAVQGE